MRVPQAFAIVLLCGSMLPVTATAADGDVTIYRCVDDAGRVMLRDSPCPAGHRQDVRQMVRPKDAPARASASAPARTASTSAASSGSMTARPQVLVVNAPRPMYECIRPDGTRYSSDGPEGSPRWVPLWTLGYPVLQQRHVVVPGHARIVVRDGRVGGELHSGHVEHQVHPTPAGYGAGTWVRDQCHALPPAEACARLRDERRALRTRFFNAQPSERDRITLLERSIDARLANDCGGL
ncbi:MAG: DUF4124 domain-containing protein [Pseudoxanthomonas suwonensis]|nr:DUF4124 domain-containing protein [Pseudoxanthomonas suwonensis]